MLNSSLCDYIDAYRLVKGTVKFVNKTAADVVANNTSVKVMPM